MKRNIKTETRKQKIKFLNDLKKGKISFTEIPEPITGMYVIYEGEYMDMKTGKTLTKEQFDKLENGKK